MQNYGTILVIDDNEAILTALKYCLAGTFERVITKTSPDGVLTLLKPSGSITPNCPWCLSQPMAMSR